MAAMGKRKIKSGQVKITFRSKRAIPERPLVTPLKYTSGLERLNGVVTPTSRLNISTTLSVGGSTVGSAIMREGFVTETGLLISSPMTST